VRQSISQRYFPSHQAIQQLAAEINANFGPPDLIGTTAAVLVQDTGLLKTRFLTNHFQWQPSDACGLNLVFLQNDT
jgi:hypothetical protein